MSNGNYSIRGFAPLFNGSAGDYSSRRKTETEPAARKGGERLSFSCIKTALREARLAAYLGEVPIGAVIVKDGKIIARAHNLRERKKNALCHAEIIAINKACRRLKSWRLDGCDMYVTLEPCAMCAGAIIQSRIKTVYFGAKDPKGGAVVSLARLFDAEGLCHKVEYFGGIEEERCSALLSSFFKKLRKKKKKAKERARAKSEKQMQKTVNE